MLAIFPCYHVICPVGFSQKDFEKDCRSLALCRFPISACLNREVLIRAVDPKDRENTAKASALVLGYRFITRTAGSNVHTPMLLGGGRYVQGPAPHRLTWKCTDGISRNIWLHAEVLASRLSADWLVVGSL